MLSSLVRGTLALFLQARQCAKKINKAVFWRRTRGRPQQNKSPPVAFTEAVCLPRRMSKTKSKSTHHKDVWVHSYIEIYIFRCICISMNRSVCSLCKDSESCYTQTRVGSGNRGFWGRSPAPSMSGLFCRLFRLRGRAKLRIVSSDPIRKASLFAKPPVAVFAASSFLSLVLPLQGDALSSSFTPVSRVHFMKAVRVCRCVPAPPGTCRAGSICGVLLP